MIISNIIITLFRERGVTVLAPNTNFDSVYADVAP